MNFSKYASEFQYNIKLAYPVILGMLGHTLIGVVDNIMVGKLGSTELAAVSLGNTMIFIAMSLGIGFSTAITPLVGQADAENNTKKITTIFHHGLWLCTILGVALFLLVILVKPLLHLLNQPKEVINMAMPYLSWVAFSLIPLILYQGYKQFADGMSFTKYAMYAILLANVVHVLINYLLMYGIWVFPRMGITGAALGTVISRIMMVIFLHIILKNNARFTIFFNGFWQLKFKKEVFQKIVQLGTPSALQMLFEVSLFTASVWLCGSIGKTSQAANQIALSLATVTFMFAMGFSVAATIRVSHCKGLLNFGQLIINARSVFLLTLLLEVVFALLFVLFHNYLPLLFLDINHPTQWVVNKEVTVIAGQLLLIAAVFQISDGIQVVVLGALRGLQDVKIPMYITGIAYWIVGFPISFFLGTCTELKAVGVWIGLLAGLTFAAIFLYLRFDVLTKKLIANQNGTT